MGRSTSHPGLSGTCSSLRTLPGYAKAIYTPPPVRPVRYGPARVNPSERKMGRWPRPGLAFAGAGEYSCCYQPQSIQSVTTSIEEETLE